LTTLSPIFYIFCFENVVDFDFVGRFVVIAVVNKADAVDNVDVVSQTVLLVVDVDAVVLVVDVVGVGVDVVCKAGLLVVAVDAVGVDVVSKAGLLKAKAAVVFLVFQIVSRSTFSIS